MDQRAEERATDDLRLRGGGLMGKVTLYRETRGDATEFTIEWTPSR